MKSTATAKNKKIVTILLVAIVLACIAGFGVYQILSPTRTTVYVFNNDYEAGTQISKSMLNAIQVDSNLIEGSGTISTGEYFITDSNYNTVLQSAGILRSDVHAGTALMKSMLTTTGGNAIEMTMKRNAVAVTIGATPVSGVTNELSAGSRVNVYTSYDGETSLPLQNIRVLSVGKSDGVLSRVTLEVDVSQSMQLIHAYTYGTVHLGLVDATGYQYTANSRPTYTTGNFGVDASTVPNDTPSEDVGSSDDTVPDTIIDAPEDTRNEENAETSVVDEGITQSDSTTTGERLN